MSNVPKYSGVHGSLAHWIPRWRNLGPKTPIKEILNMKFIPITLESFESEPTPICDSCACDGARLGETVAVPASVARRLEKEQRICERQLSYWRRLAESWAMHATGAMQPETFYGSYDEAAMRAMQALLFRQIRRSAELEAVVQSLLDQVDETRHTSEPASLAIERAKRAIYSSPFPQ